MSFRFAGDSGPPTETGSFLFTLDYGYSEPGFLREGTLLSPPNYCMSLLLLPNGCISLLPDELKYGWEPAFEELLKPRALFVFSSSLLSSLDMNKPVMTLNFLARKMPKKIIRKPMKKTTRLRLSSPSHCG